MMIPSTVRKLVLGCAALVLTSSAFVALPARGAGAAANSAAGIGTKAALDSPLCDPATGRIKIPAYLASVCVKEWKPGDDNGGATYQGVTKDKVKIVVYVAPNDVQLNPPSGGQPPRNRSTGQNGLIQDAILDAQAALDGRYELWGRTIEYDFVTYTGTDEASQRADAVTVAAMKPFAVVSTPGGAVFSTEIAKRKIVMPWGGGSNEANLAQQPYRFTGQDANLQAKNVATWLGKQIAGHKARWAGDPDFQQQTRKFGLLYTVSPTSGNDIDLDGFKAELAEHGVPKLAGQVAYTVPADSAQASAAAQEQAPLIIAKMKDAGVTSIILMGSSTIVAPMTKAATANDYQPEWLMTGWAYQELSLFAAQYDQDQWAHAFGMSWFAPFATDQRGAVTAENVLDWYWGTNKGTTASGGMPVVYWLNQGIQLAGPKLTPKSFRDGQFAQPGSGGAFQDQVTTQGNKVGDLGLGYPEYSLLGPKDFALVWWDPSAKGLGNILGSEQTGNYQYLDGGKRYTLETWKKGEPKFFEKLPSTVVYYTQSPAKDVPPQYPCTGCPSQGGNQQPANVRAS
jgi:hypothetical protein